jgi:uncharacterized membrane protein
LLLHFNNFSLPFLIGLPLSFLLALPSIIDWVTQKLGFRHSSNDIRLSTGFLEGLGVASLNLLDITPFYRFLIVTVLSLSVLGLGYMGRTIVRHWNKLS